VAVVGDNCIDLILPPIGQRLVGGNAVNVGVQLARLGAQVSYFGAVGRDSDGGLVADALRRNGVDLAYLVERDLPTARTTISVDAAGDRRFDHEDFGACDGYAPDGAAREALLGMDHVHIGWLNDGGALRGFLAAAGVPVSQDVSVNAAPEHLGVGGLAIAFAARAGSHAEARAFASGLTAAGARGVVVTRGAEGSSAFLPEGAAEAAARPVDPVDTTGAGDSYIAGFLFARLSGATVDEAAAAGARLAAETCRHSGGFPQAPSPLE
jgi:fructoselysine 6-kinase